MFSDIARIYIKARLNGGSDGDNYSEMEDAADEIGLAYCLANSTSASEYNYFQEHNGVDH